MPPSVDAHLRKLRSASGKERLEAARYFAENALPAHEKILREAIEGESVLWIKGALRRALARIVPDPNQFSSSLDTEDAPKDFAAQVYAEALETTASQLIHEIEPLLGSLRLAAETEVPSFDASKTRKSLDRIDQFVDALARLRRAASSPRLEEFSLDELVAHCIAEAGATDGISILKAGTQPCLVEGDSGLVSLSFSNGLRNAIEATVLSGPDFSEKPITVNWGSTDRDFWISIVDVGIGFKGNLQRAFSIGSTTKAGHLGMGLAIASQALHSMDGRVLLVPKTRGVRFEMRWPRAAS